MADLKKFTSNFSDSYNSPADTFYFFGQTINGTSGNDWLRGGNGPDTMNGGYGIDFLMGGAGADKIHGGEGDDLLMGESGNDMIWGDGGNDRIMGGAGRDILNGGAGNDTYVYTGVGESGVSSATADVIILNPGDKIDVPDSLLSRPMVASIDYYHDVRSTSIDTTASRSNATLWGAILELNPDTDTGYLLMDLNNDHVFETGIEIHGLTMNTISEDYLSTILI